MLPVCYSPSQFNREYHISTRPARCPEDLAPRSKYFEVERSILYRAEPPSRIQIKGRSD